MTIKFDDDLVLNEDKTFEESIRVNGHIRSTGSGRHDLTVRGNIDAWNIDAKNIDAKNIDARNIYAVNIDANDIRFYAFCIAYDSIKCSSIEGRRSNSIYEALDGEVKIREKPETCDCCGQELPEDAEGDSSE